MSIDRLLNMLYYLVIQRRKAVLSCNTKRGSMRKPDELLVFLDPGHGFIKIIVNGEETYFYHAVVDIGTTEFESVMSNYSDGDPASRNYIMVNGSAYAVAEAAENYDRRPRVGAARYIKEHVGVLFCSALSRVYREDHDNVRVFVSYPPDLVKFQDDLMRSILGKWSIVSCGKQIRYRVRNIDTFVEPYGGMMNAVLKWDGTPSQKSVVTGTVLALDVGHGTTDVLKVSASGEPDYGVSKSIKIGIGSVIEDFEAMFIAKHINSKKSIASGLRDAIKDSGGHLPIDRVRDALVDNFFNGGGRDPIECADEVDKAFNRLLNEVYQFYTKDAGGPLRYDTILVTGGGGGIIFDRLQSKLNHGNIKMAATPDAMHLANVRGGAKLWRLYELTGVV